MSHLIDFFIAELPISGVRPASISSLASDDKAIGEAAAAAASYQYAVHLGVLLNGARVPLHQLDVSDGTGQICDAEMYYDKEDGRPMWLL